MPVLGGLDRKAQWAASGPQAVVWSDLDPNYTTTHNIELSMFFYVCQILNIAELSFLLVGLLF